MNSYNSSIARVRPVFQQLLSKDRTGREWLPKILGLASRNQDHALRLAENPGALLDWVITPRSHPEPSLRQWDVFHVSLEACFEHALPPPAAFLEWLIENPKRMQWPSKSHAVFGRAVQRHRRDLFGFNGQEAAESAKREALKELSDLGPEGCKRKWWAFEGFTIADCCLETETMILAIEGKSREKVSYSTSWYPQRNQIVRELESLQQAAGDKQYALMVIEENAGEDIDLGTVAAGLPHLSAAKRRELMKHYLGTTTWNVVCAATGVNFRRLPDTSYDVALRLRYMSERKKSTP